MEAPTGWSLLIAAIVVSRLEKANETWAFLLHLGVVREGPGHQQRFVDALADVLARPPITGPSPSAQLAGALDVALLGPRAGEPDPNAARARAARDRWSPR